MADYIKRSDLIGNFPYNMSFCDESDIDNWINSIPSVDVRENVHGEWLNYYGKKQPLNKKGETTGESYCSVCKMFLMASDEYECYGNFCPYCGSDMRY